MTHSPASSIDLSQITPEEVAALAARLENDEYNNPFDGLKDWHMLRTIAFQREDLAEPYLYLLDLEEFDES